MSITRRTFAKSALALAGVGIARPARAAEITLNAVHFTPAQVSYARSFLAFVAKLNERGKGVVQIKVRGGPEILPLGQLGDAQKSGLVDIINCPAGPYLNLVPEGEVFSATSKTPAELRANGGFALINEIYGKKGNAFVLAHVDGGAGFHIFTVDEPTRTADGSIDFSKLKIRSAALYRDFLEKLGASVVVQGPGEVYTSLERGLVNANAYSVAGYAGFGWNKFTKYRIDPSFFQTDVLISINKAKWDSLPAEAKTILQTVAIEYEAESIAASLKTTADEGKALIDGGMKVVAMPDAQKTLFLDTAIQASWSRLEKRDPSNIAALRAKFG
ncbi:TRAP transporter substrate-binding protein DctP [Prosthecomicrobium hirschii]|uniref:TRAP transporter substrate-binding protein DctP n=1 Tax=Prosthecodimorpha hirschii TaxID=665126 RepID=UPI00221F61FF|nr:TRAP transporter substrate-binding protein DctP [Prosthecomicrobium hirschii]MCW1838840.1 TRAP transporter substrate-binding protein DctP [Prosthecomicrobium hirschii]